MLKSFYCLLLASVSLMTVDAQNLLPITDSLGKLPISIDPRTELLGAVQLISDYPHCTRNTPYSDRTQAYFGSFAGSDAAEWTKELYDKFGFAYDAPAALMLYYTDPPELRNRHPYSGYLIGRAGGEENLQKYRKTLSKFAGESRFVDFWSENEAFYRRTIDAFKREMGDIDFVRQLEDYYRMRGDRYHVILCPLFGDCNYGSSVSNADGTNEMYAFLGLSGEKDGVPVFARNSTLSLILHEFGHSFVNPTTEKFADVVARYDALFEPIRVHMTRMAYNNWETCVNEHIVRAVVIRLLEKMNMNDLAADRLQYELRNYFGYVPALLEKLREYEVLRDVGKVTFEDYMPTLLGAFDGIEAYSPKFIGPVNNAFFAPKAICVYPTAGGEATAAAADYAKKMAEFMNSNLPGQWTSVADTTALNMPIGEYNVVCYGTMESNLLLKKYASAFPFRVETGVLYADKKYEDPAVKLISCIPNPENPAAGMIVYTALDDKQIVDINNVFHGPEDYYIFLDQEKILSHGNYDKSTGNWKFRQP